MKRSAKLLGILIALILFTGTGFALTENYNECPFSICAQAISVGDSVDDGVIVPQGTTYCGCCHDHNHGNSFGDKISCFFCKIKMFFTNLFGNKDDVTNHKYIIVESTNSTCFQEGYVKLKCAVCSKQKIITSKTLPHTEEIILAVEATCTATGRTQGKKCSVCGEILLSPETVPMKAHTQASPVKENEVASTCSKAGSYDEVVYCSVCGVELSRTEKTVSKLPHTEVIIPAVEATCTATGRTQGKKCSVCGEIILSPETVPMKAHTQASPVKENEVASTCSKAGSYDEVVYCSVCGLELSTTEKTVSKLSHTEEIIPAVEATCTATGRTQGKKCSVCGEILLSPETVPMKAHTPANAVKENVTSDGYDEVTYCSVCAKEISRTHIDLKTLTRDDFSLLYPQAGGYFYGYDAESDSTVWNYIESDSGNVVMFDEDVTDIVVCDDETPSITYSYRDVNDEEYSTLPTDFGVYTVVADVAENNGYKKATIELMKAIINTDDAPAYAFVRDDGCIVGNIYDPNATDMTDFVSMIDGYSTTQTTYLRYINESADYSNDYVFHKTINEDEADFGNGIVCDSIDITYNPFLLYADNLSSSLGNNENIVVTTDESTNTINIAITGDKNDILVDELTGTGLKSALLLTDNDMIRDDGYKYCIADGWHEKLDTENASQTAYYILYDLGISDITESNYQTFTFEDLLKGSNSQTYPVIEYPNVKDNNAKLLFDVNVVLTFSVA